MTYQLLYSVEEDKVCHGIKIRMILNIALFESLAELPAWRNLQILLLRSLFGYRAWL